MLYKLISPALFQLSSDFLDINIAFTNMKFTIVCFFALIVAISAAPTKISSNNVGDIISVGVNANLDIDSNIDATLVKILGQLINDQQFKFNLPGQDASGISPGLIQNVVKMLSNQ